MEILLYLLNMVAVSMIAFMSLRDEQRGAAAPLTNLFRPTGDDTPPVDAGSQPADGRRGTRARTR